MMIIYDDHMAARCTGTGTGHWDIGTRTGHWDMWMGDNFGNWGACQVSIQKQRRHVNEETADDDDDYTNGMSRNRFASLVSGFQ